MATTTSPALDGTGIQNIIDNELPDGRNWRYSHSDDWHRDVWTRRLESGPRGEYREIRVVIDDNTLTVDVMGTEVRWTNPTGPLVYMAIDFIRTAIDQDGVL